MTDQIVQGLLLGGYYALIACGLSFMFSVMRIINLAHGSLAVAAAYVTLVFHDNLRLPLWVCIPASIALMGAVGWLLHKLILDRVTRGGELLPVLSTFGLAMVIDNALFAIFGADTRSLGDAIGDFAWESWELPGNIFVGKLPALTFLVAIIVLGSLQFVLSHTSLGRAVRATAEDADTAGMVGIDSWKVKAIASAIALSTVGIAGIFLGMRSTFDPYSGSTQILFAFEAAVIGGTGSLWGTLIGGIVLGCAQTFGASVHPLGFLIAGHTVFLLVLFGRLLSPAHFVIPAMFVFRGERK